MFSWWPTTKIKFCLLKEKKVTGLITEQTDPQERGTTPHRGTLTRNAASEVNLPIIFVNKTNPMA